MTHRYFYIKNLQGDVTGILDSTGTVVANYTYDVWGQPLTVTDGSGNDVSGNAGHIANRNPLRYRGYCYDTDTGLYYLQSRYYDPEIGRFINADDWTYLGESNTVLSYNLFTYCENNPIKYSDGTGNAIVVAGVVLSTGAVLCIVGALIFCFSYIVSSKFRKNVNNAINWAITSQVKAVSSIINKYKISKWIAKIIVSLVSYQLAKRTPIPGKLKSGDKVKTPNSHPGEYTKKKGGTYKHKKPAGKPQNPRMDITAVQSTGI